MLKPTANDCSAYVIDTRTGEYGSAAEWVEKFAHVWAAPSKRLERLMALLGPDIVLKAPTVPPKTIGQQAGRRAFVRALHAMPDLTASIMRWSASGDVIFIEMTFRATIGRRHVAWHDVDRILFRGGVAVERIAYFDPAPVRRAFLGSPAALRQYLRLRFGTRGSQSKSE